MNAGLGRPLAAVWWTSSPNCRYALSQRDGLMRTVRRTLCRACADGTRWSATCGSPTAKGRAARADVRASGLRQQLRSRVRAGGRGCDCRRRAAVDRQCLWPTANGRAARDYLRGALVRLAHAVEYDEDVRQETGITPNVALSGGPARCNDKNRTAEGRPLECRVGQAACSRLVGERAELPIRPRPNGTA